MTDFGHVFAELRQIMLDNAAQLPIARDAAGDLFVHSARKNVKSGAPEMFGAVTIKRGYVAYHLFALYTDPALGADLSAALTKRRQGKSCFNFKTADAGLFSELAELTRRAAQRDTS